MARSNIIIFKIMNFFTKKIIVTIIDKTLLSKVYLHFKMEKINYYMYIISSSVKISLKYFQFHNSKSYSISTNGFQHFCGYCCNNCSGLEAQATTDCSTGVTAVASRSPPLPLFVPSCHQLPSLPWQRPTLAVDHIWKNTSPSTEL